MRLAAVNRYDIQFVVTVLWGKADSVTREPVGQGATLARWDQRRGATRDNLVLVTATMADKLRRSFRETAPHAGHPALPELTPTRVAWIEQRLALAQQWAFQL